MGYSIFISVTAFVFLVALLRRSKMSLGLPIAYLFSLLLIHLPGAYAHWVGSETLNDGDYAALGMQYTAIGVVFFVAGVWLTRFRTPESPIPSVKADRNFFLFCLFGGWLFTYGLSPLGNIPSIGAVVEKSGAIWILGVLLGLRAAVKNGDPKRITMWLAALSVYPILMLLLGGFLSYGSKAAIIALAVLTISVRSNWRVSVGIVVVSFVGFSSFLSYFANRDAIRDAVWGGASLEERVDVSMNIFRDFELMDLTDEIQLSAFDQRLNQNYFVGVAATRIHEGQVDFLSGRSLWEGIISLVPRFFWPDKPVFAGSPVVVSEMTGLILSETTSFGVGNVMEFYINYGIPGLIAGFLVLGWLLGKIDRMAAIAEGRGDFGQVVIYFLPAVALIQPNGSIVELTGGSVSALIAAYGWRYAWKNWSKTRIRTIALPTRVARRDS